MILGIVGIIFLVIVGLAAFINGIKALRNGNEILSLIGISFGGAIILAVIVSIIVLSIEDSKNAKEIGGNKVIYIIVDENGKATDNFNQQDI